MLGSCAWWERSSWRPVRIPSLRRGRRRDVASRGTENAHRLQEPERSRWAGDRRRRPLSANLDQAAAVDEESRAGCEHDAVALRGRSSACDMQRPTLGTILVLWLDADTTQGSHRGRPRLHCAATFGWVPEPSLLLSGWLRSHWRALWLLARRNLNCRSQPTGRMDPGF